MSRKAIFIRDRYECQYCGAKSNLTIDHVIPSSRGGEWRYDNLVAAWLTHPLFHPLAHSLMNSPTRSLTRSLAH